MKVNQQYKDILKKWIKEKIFTKNFSIDIFNIKNLTRSDLAEVITNIEGLVIVPSKDGNVSQVSNENSTHDWGKNTDYFPFHLDGGYYKEVPQYVILYCVNDSDTGGETFFTSANAVIASLSDKYDANFLESLSIVWISAARQIYTKPLIQNMLMVYN